MQAMLDRPPSCRPEEPSRHPCQWKRVRRFGVLAEAGGGRLEDSDADAHIAKNQRLKEEAATAITQWMRAEKLTQVAASQFLEASRPRMPDLVDFKLGRFSLDTLVALLFRTGKNVHLIVR